MTKLHITLLFSAIVLLATTPAAALDVIWTDPTTDQILRGAADGSGSAIELFGIADYPGSPGTIDPQFITVVPEFDPADADKDGDVDTADLTTMFQNFTGNVGGVGGKTMMDGDTDMDGDVDTNDLVVGFQNFTGSQAAQAASVPEPSSVVLLVLGLVGLAGFWRVRRH